MAQWIWQFGDYEIYHHLQMHNMRHHYGRIEPVTWKLYTPDPVVCFRKRFTTTGGTLHIYACGYFSVMIRDAEGGLQKFCGAEEITLTPGTYTLDIRVENIREFPCVYVNGIVESDESWLSDDLTIHWRTVGTDRAFGDIEQPPVVFPFQYKAILYKTRELIGDGVLFDYGQETYARVRLNNLQGQAVSVQYGESREEALDAENSVIHFCDTPKDGGLQYRPFAFRYLYISDVNVQIQADYEYLPLSYRGQFICDNERLNTIWKTAGYTFHLNCREFFLDGIKRDHWLWAGDAYQSLFVNRYLFYDKDIEQRTLIALGGKQPFGRHLNEIVDYTFLWIMGVYEHYITYGDLQFLQQLYPQLEAVMQYCLERRDTDGFIRKKEGDWIFIDWAPMDMQGAVCGEQILLAKAMECYSRLCRVLAVDDMMCGEMALALQAAIKASFYDPAQKAYIDSYESGRHNVTRQNNILAYLFLPCADVERQQIYNHVVCNPAIPAITTPYFKFYENLVRCEEGQIDCMQQEILDYYGGMLDIGATTFYEEYDPTKRGVEHYAMYGAPFEKSLCHAWSASPIYLLGAYRLGIRNTGVAYDHYEVRPNLGDLQYMKGSVPTPGGNITIEMDRSQITVSAELDGGVLYWRDRCYSIEKDIPLHINI